MQRRCRRQASHDPGAAPNRAPAAAQKRDPRVRVIDLSRNFGQQAAIAAGLGNSAADATVVMDGDLQDPPELIPEMVARWRAGFDVVAMVKTGTEGRGALKVVLAHLFYRVFNALSEVAIAPGGSELLGTIIGGAAGAAAGASIERNSVQCR